MSKKKLTKLFDSTLNQLSKKGPNVYEQFAEADDTAYKLIAKNISTTAKQQYKDYKDLIR